VIGMLLSCIQNLEVINVVDGRNIGNIVDMEIEPISGQILCIYVEICSGLFNLFNKAEKIVLNWEQIVKIGEDVIIVNYPYKNVF
jgi:YlmC/YmxH family sporulation protein